jgi:hypothetical protein
VQTATATATAAAAAAAANEVCPLLRAIVSCLGEESFSPSPGDVGFDGGGGGGGAAAAADEPTVGLCTLNQVDP